MDLIEDGIDIISELLGLLFRFWYITLGLLLLLLLVLLNSGTDTTTKTQPRQSHPIVLYHYTDQVGMANILLDNEIAASSSGVKYGQGVFLTDLPPTGLLSARDLATALYSGYKGSVYVQHYLELSVDSSLIYWQSYVVWQKLPVSEQAAVKNYSIYRIAGSRPLPLTGNLITTGDTIFKP